MSVKAKFYVQSVERHGSPVRWKEGEPTWDETRPAIAQTNYVKVNLAPVYAPKDAQCENAKYFKATPSGQLWMQIDNPAAFDYFVEGQEYYLTFEKA